MKWTTIRTFGRVKYFNLCYVVVLVVPLLAHTYIGATKFGLLLSFPSPLKLLYIASVCYAIGLFLYQVFCPSIIKQYESARDYLEAEEKIYLNARPDRKVEIILANLADGQEGLGNSLEELSRLQLTSPNTSQGAAIAKIIHEHYSSSIQRFLLAEYGRKNTKRRWLIVVSGLFYLAGTALMLWLLIHKSIDVFKV